MGEVPSTWAVTRQIINESGFGLGGLNRGLTATIGRNGVFNMIYFGFYHSVKGVLPEYQVGFELFFFGFALLKSFALWSMCNFTGTLNLFLGLSLTHSRVERFGRGSR